MNENISLGRIFGIHVGFNWSLLVVAALIAWSLATGILPPAAPGETSSAYWTAGVVSAFVFLASLLAHELAHSVVAVRRGVKVEGITLWLFGGVSRFSSETNSPGSQALITFVGPLTSLVLGVVFYCLFRLLLDNKISLGQLTAVDHTFDVSPTCSHTTVVLLTRVG